jgi:hypothetical protein
MRAISHGNFLSSSPKTMMETFDRRGPISWPQTWVAKRFVFKTTREEPCTSVLPSLSAQSYGSRSNVFEYRDHVERKKSIGIGLANYGHGHSGTPLWFRITLLKGYHSPPRCRFYSHKIIIWDRRSLRTRTRAKTRTRVRRSYNEGPRDYDHGHSAGHCVF